MTYIHLLNNKKLNSMKTLSLRKLGAVLCASSIMGLGSAAQGISFNPASLSDSLNACGDSAALSLYVVNKGAGNLTFNILGTNSNAPVKILAMIYGSDLTTMYPNTISAISQYFTNYTVDTTSTRSASVLTAALSNYDVLLFLSRNI